MSGSGEHQPPAAPRAVELPAWAPYLGAFLAGVCGGGPAGAALQSRGVDELRVRMEAVTDAVTELKTEVRALRGPSDRSAVERDELRRRVGELERRLGAVEQQRQGGGR